MQIEFPLIIHRSPIIGCVKEKHESFFYFSPILKYDLGATFDNILLSNSKISLFEDHKGYPEEYFLPKKFYGVPIITGELDVSLNIFSRVSWFPPKKYKNTTIAHKDFNPKDFGFKRHTFNQFCNNISKGKYKDKIISRLIIKDTIFWIRED